MSYYKTFYAMAYSLRLILRHHDPLRYIYIYIYSHSDHLMAAAARSPPWWQCRSFGSRRRRGLAAGRGRLFLQIGRQVLVPKSKTSKRQVTKCSKQKRNTGVRGVGAGRYSRRRRYSSSRKLLNIITSEGSSSEGSSRKHAQHPQSQ